MWTGFKVSWMSIPLSPEMITVICVITVLHMEPDMLVTHYGDTIPIIIRFLCACAAIQVLVSSGVEMIQ